MSAPGEQGQLRFSSTVQVAIDGQDTLGEMPLWCELTRTLTWIDIDGRTLKRYSSDNGQLAVHKFDCEFLGSLALTTNPSKLLIALDLALYLFDLESKYLKLVCQVEPKHLRNRLNDGRCDARGRFWVGTMDVNLTEPHGSFYRIDPDGKVCRMFGGVIVSNTVCTTPEQDGLYFSDTRRYQTWRFPLDVTSGQLGKRAIFVDHTNTRSRPDGACVDSEGHVWIAMFGTGKVVRHSPDGTPTQIIDLPVTNPTCVCLGGALMRTLYITTARKFLDSAQLAKEPWAGSVLSVTVDVPGQNENRFGPPVTRS